jgi:4a-hydroxytetrahydrobiopterin dehydratase
MKNNNSYLLSKTCTLYHNDLLPLTSSIVIKLLSELEDKWGINELGQLYKEYQFSNFTEAMNFANKISEIAEMESHHPDLEISWGKCFVKIWTHKINGLTENDFILAAKINKHL